MMSLVRFLFLVAFEFADQVAAGGIVELHALVEAGRDDLLAVRSPDDAVDRGRRGHGMGRNRLGHGAFGYVPDTQVAVVTAASEQVAGSVERYGINQARVSQALGRPVRGRLPDLDCFVLACGVDTDAVGGESDVAARQPGAVALHRLAK